MALIALRKQKEQLRENGAVESGISIHHNSDTVMKSPTRADTENSVHIPQSIWALASLDLIDELQIRLFNTSPDEINLKNPDIEETALYYAATNGSLEIANLLRGQI